jgi:predicted N-acetyltransferase YhbS
MIKIVREAPAEAGAREALLDLAFGKHRRRKSSERLRENRLPAGGLAFAAKLGNGRLVGTLRLWHVNAGENRPALLLGPLAVHPAHRNHGIGTRLMQEALARAKALGHRAIILVGDEPYYRRFGFSAEAAANLHMPGPFERHRLLARELMPGALANARGLIAASGEVIPQPPKTSTRIAGRSLTSRIRRAS